MIPEARHWRLAGGALVVVLAIPVLAEAVRGPGPPSCALDGVEIEPTYAVEVTDSDDGARRFCCVRCAEAWISKRRELPEAIRVTDEISGVLVDDDLAWFVHSPLVTVPATGSRTHVFADRSDALSHVREHGGHLLEGAERPFRGPSGPRHPRGH